MNPMSSTMSLNFSPPSPNLQYLPAELVDEIAQYLSPLSKLSLRYTCHRFRHYFPVTIELLRDQCSSKPDWSPEEHGLWYHFLWMLERDQCISQLLCTPCNQTHHISLFSHSAQKTFPRRCLASEDKPWVCPHASYTRAEISFLRARAQAFACKHARSSKNPLLKECLRFLKDFLLWQKDYCLWLASHPGIHSQFPAQYDRSRRMMKFPAHYYCSCRKIKMSQHMLFFHIEASKFRLLQARVEKALGMSAVVKCVHMRNPTNVPVKSVKHEDCKKTHRGDLSFRCRLCMEYGVVNEVSK